ncbi:S-methyl-5-thioribose kinase [Clostridium sp. Marseille-Q2269]|uniref:S-methyl-5-thioribose kinase n=1 Tax=Clostridium sp. Marseille-Q2269 TaxID=2942205 RepID=UPI0020739149|nr:S-methyl-5-thioribose kinase [Clostridium sp. Marseille-Q2269]
MAEYKPMDCESIIKYIRELKLDIFDENSNLDAKEIGDGNLNLVFRVKDINTGKSVIVKQALPYLRVAGEGWKLTVERNKIEAQAMIEQNNACINSAPKIHYCDNDYKLYVAEDLGNMDILRNGLMNMKKYSKFPRQIGKFLARNLFYTSDLGLGAVVKKSLVGQFINPELCDITERLVFTDPYISAESNDINPKILYEVRTMWKRKDFTLEVAKLKNIFMTKAEALLHGDLHTGSIFITEDYIKVFDTEFAFYGPYGYDIGLLFANFILNYVSWEGRQDKSKEEIREFRKYLLNTIEEIWSEFEKNLYNIWDKNSKEVYSTVEGYKEYYINNLLHETLGFASCEVIRRIVGMAHVPDFDILEDLDEKAKAQILGLKIGQTMIMRRNTIKNIEELSTLILEITR